MPVSNTILPQTSRVISTGNDKSKIVVAKCRSTNRLFPPTTRLPKDDPLQQPQISTRTPKTVQSNSAKPVPASKTRRTAVFNYNRNREENPTCCPSDLLTQQLQSDVGDLQLGVAYTSLDHVMCQHCYEKPAILNCLNCTITFCAACFGATHLDAKKIKHKIVHIFSSLRHTRKKLPVRRVDEETVRFSFPLDHLSLSAGDASKGQKSLTTPERRKISGAKHNVQSTENHQSRNFEVNLKKPTPSLLNGDYDEVAARESFQTAVSAFRRKGMIQTKPEETVMFTFHSEEPLRCRRQLFPGNVELCSTTTQTAVAATDARRYESLLSQIHLPASRGDHGHLEQLIHETRSRWLYGPTIINTEDPPDNSLRPTCFEVNNTTTYVHAAGQLAGSGGGFPNQPATEDSGTAKDSADDPTSPEVARHRVKVAKLLKFAGAQSKADQQVQSGIPDPSSQRKLSPTPNKAIHQSFTAHNFQSHQYHERKPKQQLASREQPLHAGRDGRVSSQSHLQSKINGSRVRRRFTSLISEYEAFDAGQHAQRKCTDVRLQPLKSSRVKVELSVSAPSAFGLTSFHSGCVGSSKSHQRIRITSDSMQIHHRPLRLPLATTAKMLDIDLPRISVTTSSDNYATGNASGKTVHLMHQPAVVLSRASSPVSRTTARGRDLTLPISCATSHLLNSSFIPPPRSRSPSFNSTLSRKAPPTPPRSPVPPRKPEEPAVRPKMAVLSRSAVVKKSPSCHNSSQMQSHGTTRSSSVDRGQPADAVVNSWRSPSPAKSKSSSSTSLHKLLRPSSPGVSRGGAKSVSPRINVVPAVAVRPGTPTCQQPRTCGAAVAVPPRRKSPVIGNRGFSLSLSPAKMQIGMAAGVPSTPGTTHDPADQHKVKYERNLKKFYTWCQHCKRVQRSQQSDASKGLVLAGNTSAAGKLHAVKPSRGSPAKIVPTAAAVRQLHHVNNSPSCSHSQHGGLFAFNSSDLPLISHRKLSNTHTNMPVHSSNMLHPGTATMDTAKERPKSARTASSTEPIAMEKPKFTSLFNFDDELSRTPDQIDLTWMCDPLDSDDDFLYDIDVETMSIRSESSIVAMAITCDTKLKDDDDDYTKTPLRKAYSSNQ